MIYYTVIKVCKTSKIEQQDRISKNFSRIINEVYQFHKNLVFC